MSNKEIENKIKKMQFTVTPRYAPKEHGPLLVVTVEGLRKLLRLRQ